MQSAPPGARNHARGEHSRANSRAAGRACVPLRGRLPPLDPHRFWYITREILRAATPARWQALTKRRTSARRWMVPVRARAAPSVRGVRGGSSIYAMHRIDRHAATHAHHIATAFRGRHRPGGSATVGSSGATRQNGSRPRVPCANKMIDSAHITGREARVEKERGHYTGVPIGTAWPWTGFTMPVLSAMT